jgi:hypothetical protein
MSQEIEQAHSSKDSADNQPQKADTQSVHVYRPKRWVPIVFLSALLAVGAVGVWFILWASRAFTDPTAALTFIMGSIISLFLLLSTVATTCIYWGQRNIMLQQWKAMGQQQAAMEWQAGIAEIQTGLVDQQVGAMKEQLEAMRGQLDAMNEQAVIMRDSLTQAQKQLEHLAVIDRAYIEIVEMRMGALKVDEMVIIKTVFLNVGRSPAWTFRFRSTLIFLEKPIPLNPDWLKYKAPRGKGRMLPAGKQFVDESPSNFIFTREQVQAMVNKTAKLILAGEIDYIDITGETQTSSFNRLYDPETGTFNEYDQTENGDTK